MTDHVDVFREVARWLRHWSRTGLVLPPVGELPVRREAASVVNFLNLNPDLLDPVRHPGRLERLSDYAFQAHDDDLRYHAGQALGTYLGARERTDLLDRILVKLLTVFTADEDLRSGAAILALASERCDSWVRRRLDYSPLSSQRLNIIDVVRKGHVSADNLDVGMASNVVDRLWFLERASKVTQGHLLAEHDGVRVAARQLVRQETEAAEGNPVWFVRALAADLAACARSTDGPTPDQLFLGMFSDPEPEVRVRLRHAWAAWALDGGIERECDGAQRLVYEIASGRQDSQLRYANGAIVDLLEPLLPTRDPEVARLVEGVLSSLHEVGRNHPNAYHRKTAVKVSAKLACRWMRRSPEAARYNVAFVLSRLADPDPIVLEEVFLSVSKRGWPELLDARQLGQLADSLGRAVELADPSLVCSLAAMLPEFLDRAGLGTLVDPEGRCAHLRAAVPEDPSRAPLPWRPWPCEADAAVEGGTSRLSALVSLMHSELADLGLWLDQVGLQDLLALGRSAGSEAAVLYGKALPATRDALGHEFPTLWNGALELAQASEGADARVLGDVLPAARRIFGDELARCLDGIVRIGKHFQWTRKSHHLFVRALEGAAALNRAVRGSRWSDLIDVTVLGGKHGYKLLDNMAFLLEAAGSGGADFVLDTAVRIIRGAEVPYEAVKRYNLVVWLLREWEGSPAVDWPALRDSLGAVAAGASPDGLLAQLGALPRAVLGDAAPAMVFVGGAPAV